MLALSLLQIYILQKNLHKQKATNTKIHKYNKDVPLLL
jgi:hypothetical protein